MPVRYVQKSSNPLMMSTTAGTASVPAPNVAALGVIARASGGNDTYEFGYNPDGTVRSLLQEMAIVIPIDANSVDNSVFIADDNWQVTKLSAVPTVAGSTNAAVTVKKCVTTTAPASGTALHATAFDLTATTNTVQNATLVATTATLQLAAGNRLALDFSGTLTNLVGNVSIFLKRIPG